MNIEQIEHGSKGAFIIKESNQRLAEMTYSRAGDSLIIIDHTEVSDALRGKGAGKQLVSAAVNYEREKKIKILPLCPFARAVFDKTPAFSDVLNT
jgi:uncharacterized protein